jgi:hypothetical protein
MLTETEVENAESAPAGKKPRSRAFKTIVFVAVGLWVFLILDCFCLILAPRHTSIGHVDVGLRAEEDVEFRQDDWGGGSKQTTIGFRHLYIVIEQ